MVAFEVPAGTVVGKGAFLFSIGDVNRRHLWYALTDHRGNVLVLTSDDSSSITNGALHTLPFCSVYIMPTDGVLYLCVVGVAGTPAQATGAATTPSAIEPILAGLSTTTGQTAPSTAPPVFGVPHTSGEYVPYALLG
jgi:hypothetical protein